MESINVFIRLLDKIEIQDRRLGMTLKNLRCLSGSKNMELAYAMALKLAEENEKMTLMTRALPAYTGNPQNSQDVDNFVEKSVPVEIGFTNEGWFCVRLPLRVPHLTSEGFCSRRSETFSGIRTRFAIRKA